MVTCNSNVGVICADDAQRERDGTAEGVPRRVYTLLDRVIAKHLMMCSESDAEVQMPRRYVLRKHGR